VPDLPRAQGRRLDDLSTTGPTRRLTARQVLADAFDLLKERPGTVVGSAALVFGTTAWVTAVVEVEIVEADSPIVLSVLAQVFAGAVTALGIVFYAGLLDLLLEAHLDHRPDPPLRVVLQRLPLFRLLGANVLLLVAAAFAALALVIPGLVVFTLLSLVGPLIVSERLGIFDAFRRSASLVRRRFWLAFVLVTVPFIVEDQLLHGINLNLAGHRLLGAFVVSAVIGATAGVAVGLLEVTLAHDLRVSLEGAEHTARIDAASETSEATP